MGILKLKSYKKLLNMSNLVTNALLARSGLWTGDAVGAPLTTTALAGSTLRNSALLRSGYGAGYGYGGYGGWGYGSGLYGSGLYGGVYPGYGSYGVWGRGSSLYGGYGYGSGLYGSRYGYANGCYPSGYGYGGDVVFDRWMPHSMGGRPTFTKQKCHGASVLGIS